MLDIALVNFIGAGVTTFAPVYNLTLPKGAMVDTAGLLRELYRLDGTLTGDVVETTARAIWTDWLASGMPTSVALSHLQQLPALIDENRPDKDLVIAAIAVATTRTKLGRGAVRARPAGLALTSSSAHAKRMP